jgi:phage baseplate assembly protein W
MGIDFIGAGWSYPLGTDATGGVALVTREREIEQAIRLILGTACGERPMRPEFGCRIHDHVFGPASSATAGQIAYDVRQALERWEPRIELNEVEVSFDAIESGTLYIDVGYEIRGLNDPRNLVFPFYVIPEHEEGTANQAIEAATQPALTSFDRPALLAGGG